MKSLTLRLVGSKLAAAKGWDVTGWRCRWRNAADVRGVRDFVVRPNFSETTRHKSRGARTMVERTSDRSGHAVAALSTWIALVCFTLAPVVAEPPVPLVSTHSSCDVIREVPADQFFPRRNPAASFREVGQDGGLVVLPERDEVKVLNPVGIRIFSLLDGQQSLRSIADKVTAEFEVDYDTALRDARTFLCELANNGMLVESAHSTAKEKPK